MEAARPRQRRRRRQERPYVETTFEVFVQDPPAVENVAASPSSLEEGLVGHLKDLHEVLIKEDTELNSIQEKIGQNRIKAKEDVKTLFDELHELLERKELEVYAKVDDVCDRLEFPVEDKIEDIKKIKEPVETMMLKCKFLSKNVSEETLQRFCSDTERQINLLEILPDDIPEFIINSDVKDTVDGLRYGRFSNEEEERLTDQFTGLTVDLPDTIDRNRNSNTTGAVYRVEERSESNGNEEIDSVSWSQNDLYDRSELSRNFGFSGEPDGVIQLTAPSSSEDGAVNRTSPSATSRTSPSADSCTSPSTVSRTVLSANSDTAPSAPPLVRIDDGDEGEEDPPPYWQAIGLSGPEEEAAQSPNTETIPPLRMTSYSDRSPDYTEFDTNQSSPSHNTLELWHSFPLRRQYDVKKPLYVSMSWDDRRICVVDRNNRMVKFYSHSGTPLAEMRISSGDIYDIAYLESCNGEARYIATLPKDKTLLLLAIMEDHSTNLVRKIILRNSKAFYTSICRGPRLNTFIGASTAPSGPMYYNMDKPHVAMFDFEGHVVQRYDRTMDYKEFQYPRSVEVHRRHIFIADWKLSLVIIFLEDGTPVGQYSGTLTNPLINPLDLTIDKYGNALVCDGEFPNIHVISPAGLPIEVIKVPQSGLDRSQPKLVAFDSNTQRLAVVRSKGDLAVYEFRAGYRAIRPGEVVLDPQSPVGVPLNESLPYVEGMLPSTIASIGRQGSRNGRVPNFLL